MWPADAAALIAEQARLAARPMPPWALDPAAPLGGCFACFARGGPGPGRAGDPGWAGASLVQQGRVAASAVVAGTAGGPYAPGLLALREGPLLEAAVLALPSSPAVLLVDGTGWDHPRGAGLALHLGAVLGLPSVGVTHRPLLAEGAWPEDRRGSAAPLHLAGRLVGYWVRTRAGARPLAVHAAWGTSPEAAVEVVLAAVGRARTPEPLRAARAAARRARAAAATA
jgi:deoxyribonuclease V